MHVQPKRNCKWCGSKEHYQTFCRQRPQKAIKVNQKPLKRTPIKKVGKQTNKWLSYRQEWFKLNPPDKDGYYYCYLRTTPLCLGKMWINETTLDHVIPKGSLKGRNLAFNEDNIKPACMPCNSDKGSQSLENYLKAVEKRKNKTF